MKAPGKHNRATAAHIPDGISERDGFAGQVHREFFVQSSKIASWPPSTPSTGSPSSTLGGTNSMRRFEFRRTGFPRDESWLRSFRRFFLARGDATELFKIAEEVFDEMTPFVHVETEIWRARPAFRGMSALADSLDQWFDPDAVVALAGQKNEAYEIAERLDHCDDLGGQATSRLDNGLISSLDAMLVGPDDRAVDDRVFEIQVTG